MTLKLAEPVLPWASVAVQVTVVMAIGNTDPDAGAQDTASVSPSTRSAAEALKVTAAPAALVASAVMLAGTVTVGGVVSVTVMLNELSADLLP